jgi:hypothetical protein
MHVLNSSATAFCLGALFMVCVPSAKATNWDKKTIITVNQPTSIGSTLLPPGTYVLRLLDSLSDRNVVQVLNADETKVEATMFAVPEWRPRVTGKTAFRYWETPAGQPPAVKTWLDPGDEYGQEFQRPPALPAAVAQAPAPPPSVPAPAPAPAPSVTAQVTPPAPPATPVTPAPAQVTPAPAAPLPKTASPDPLLGLLGLLSLGAAAGARTVLRLNE